MEGTCSRCGSCCRYIPMPVKGMDKDYLNFLRMRGLKEDQGFVLIPQDCQHLHLQYVALDPAIPKLETNVWTCEIHNSPDRPMLCRKYHGQKQIGRFLIYRPPGCTMVIK